MEVGSQSNAPAALPRGKNARYQLKRVGRSVVLDVLENRFISWPCRDFNPRSPARVY